MRGKHFTASSKMTELLSHFSGNQELETNSADEAGFLINLVNEVKNFSTKSRVEQNNLLKNLEAYECLMQAVKLLHWRIINEKVSNDEIFYDFLWILRIYYFGLEDFDGFLAIASECIEKLQISFALFRMHVVEAIVGFDNFHEQSRLYSHACQFFLDKKEKIALLERLALIYEKKLFLEEDVDSAYSRLLEIDPLNVKALRFYKFFYVQTAQWREVVRHLELLIGALINPLEKQRAAHELAQIYLYNLNQPQKARDILKEYCAEYVLDIHVTLTEALERLGQYDELTAILKKIDNGCENPQEKAEVRLKLAWVAAKAGKFPEAVDSARACIEINPSGLLAYEALLTSLVEMGNIKEINEALQSFSKLIKHDASKAEIIKLCERTAKLSVSHS